MVHQVIKMLTVEALRWGTAKVNVSRLVKVYRQANELMLSSSFFHVEFSAANYVAFVKLASGLDRKEESATEVDFAY